MSSVSLPTGVVHRDVLSPPLWLEGLLATAPLECWHAPIESAQAELRGSEGYSLTSLRLPCVEEMDILTFQQTIADAYRLVLEQIGVDHALRFWAFIPRIHADYGQGLDRYMAFNAGRFAAFSAWLGGRDAFGRSVPTGSAVGSRSSGFEVHCLASRWPGHPIENPRQVPAYRYSKRFGPLPPCFARATIVRRQPFQADLLLVGGTASIVGEETRHLGDLGLQAAETCRNLASVVSAAAGATPAAPPDAEVAEWLSLFREVRVYYRNAEDRAHVLDLAQASFGGAERIEMLQAELCRSELLIEIEGVASLPDAGPRT